LRALRRAIYRREPGSWRLPTGSQEDPIQGNFLYRDGRVDDLDILHLLQFVGGVPGILAASACPNLGETEPISGFKWGDVNCDVSVDAADVTFMLAD